MTAFDELAIALAKSSDEFAVGAKFWGKNAGLLDDILLNPSMVKGLKWTKGGSKADLLLELVGKMDNAALTQMKSWTRILDTAVGKVDGISYANLVQRQGSQASVYATKMIDELGLPARHADELTGVMRVNMNSMWKNGTIDNAKSLLGKVDEPSAAIAKGSEDLITSTAKGQGILSRFTNGTLGAVKRRPKTTMVVLAGGMYVIGWLPSLKILSGLVTTLEKWGFIPSGSGNGLIAMWGRLRSIISVVIFGGLIVGTFYLMNVVFGVAKTVKSGIDTVADVVTPDAEPSGA